MDYILQRKPLQIGRFQIGVYCNIVIWDVSSVLKKWGILGLSRKVLKNLLKNLLIEDARTMRVKLQNKRRARFSE